MRSPEARNLNISSLEQSLTRLSRMEAKGPIPNIIYAVRKMICRIKDTRANPNSTRNLDTAEQRSQSSTAATDGKIPSLIEPATITPTSVLETPMTTDSSNLDDQAFMTAAGLRNAFCDYESFNMNFEFDLSAADLGTCFNSSLL
jgi:hypothetical protein